MSDEEECDHYYCRCGKIAYPHCAKCGERLKVVLKVRESE